MWGKKTVSLIVPVSKGKNSLVEVIQDFDSTGYVDEIVVVSDQKTEEDYKIRTRARYLVQKKSGFGIAIKEGIKSTKSDLLIITEPNGSFKGKDILKLLSYSDDFDTVFGSRTHLPLIQRGSGMTFARRIIDDIFGKIITFLFFSPPLTDVGCTLRLTNRKGWNKVSKECKAPSEMFLTEWLIVAAKNKVRFVEVPVNFSAPLGLFPKNSYLHHSLRAIKIFSFILKERFLL